jgi:lipopolysaccharide/colanic/teichoic acid biosynthesis glycosyltransferase
MFSLLLYLLRAELSAPDKSLDIPDAIRALPTHPSVNSLLKRCLDIAGGVVGLLITLCLLVPIAIAIQLDSPGRFFIARCGVGIEGDSFTFGNFVQW